MKTFPKLVTDRLILDKIVATDIVNIVKYANNAKVTDNTRTMPFPYLEKDANEWISNSNLGFEEGDLFMFAIRLKDTAEFIGGIGLSLNVDNNRAELGYWLAEPYWSKGIATEAVQCIFDFGFNELNLNKITAVYLTTNEASGKVMIKNGMTKEAELKDHDVKKDHTISDGKYVSLFQYRMLKSEYKLLQVKS